MNFTSPFRALGELARLHGVQQAYFDIVARRRRRASSETLMAVLKAMGVCLERIEDAPDTLRETKQAQCRRGLEPVTVAWEDARVGVELCLPEAELRGPIACCLREETAKAHRWACHLSGLGTQHAFRVEGVRYVRKWLPVPMEIGWGYHQFTCEVGGRQHTALLVRAPRRAFAPREGQAARSWGVFLPLYSLRGHEAADGSSFSDVAALGDWVRQMGGSVIATLPFSAAFLDEPFDSSPYAPASRLFWNEFYLDVEGLVRAHACRLAGQRLQSPAVRRQREELRAASTVDYRRGMAWKRKVLEDMAQCFFTGESEDQASFRTWLGSNPPAQDYARFRAVCDRRREPWPSWPGRLRDGHLGKEDYDAAAQRYHLLVQWLVGEQLRGVSGKGKNGRPSLYLDYPLGVHPAGYDTWREREAFALEVSAGAPPDSFFTKGQIWGFPPLHPERIRAQGYRYYIACLRHQLEHAGALRIDHVMGLHRLYWVPPGHPAVEGAYVRYRAEEFYAILALESHRHQALIVGEDLGTVPRYVPPAMARHGLHRMYVVQYQLTANSRRALRSLPANAVASMNTHDMPTFASFWKGGDIQRRVRMGLLNPRTARREERKRQALRKALVAFLRRKSWLPKSSPAAREVLQACLAYLGASRARMVIVNLEDLWLETQPQNVPGTGGERPNWQRKARYSLERIRHLPSVRETLRSLDAGRKQAGAQ